CHSLPRKNNHIVDFSSIKRLLDKDGLRENIQKKTAKQLEQKKIHTQKTVQSFDIPGEEDFWGLVSQLWLVKNAEILKWDFQKPDYGIEVFFNHFLKEVGKTGIRFNILLGNSKIVTHFALPANHNEYLFILSIPFIRALDLSKLEIALLLYEDIFRSDLGLFKKFVLDDEVRKFIGSNFYKKKYPKNVLNNIMNKYDKFILEKGFDFNQQFRITKLVDTSLHKTSKYRNAYRSMIKKKVSLVKSNPSFSRYPQIYPSPELQINWLVLQDDNS
ncbi:MAG: hypothetical protein OXB84_08510, partial [Halobacteriovoraceae bacterium]|nr:hypothetical protein [Halobacteriovoraceae bacterium]